MQINEKMLMNLFRELQQKSIVGPFVTRFGNRRRNLVAYQKALADHQYLLYRIVECMHLSPSKDVVCHLLLPAMTPTVKAPMISFSGCSSSPTTLTENMSQKGTMLSLDQGVYLASPMHLRFLPAHCNKSATGS